MWWESFIKLVQANPHLYSKSQPGYSGKTVDKSLSWQTIGSSMSPALTGKSRVNSPCPLIDVRLSLCRLWYHSLLFAGREAESARNKLRGKFGRQLKQVRESKRSGVGASDVFTPTWSLYQYMEFMTDHIKPRK